MRNIFVYSFSLRIIALPTRNILQVNQGAFLYRAYIHDKSGKTILATMYRHKCAMCKTCLYACIHAFWAVYKYSTVIAPLIMLIILVHVHDNHEPYSSYIVPRLYLSPDHQHYYFYFHLRRGWCKTSTLQSCSMNLQMGNTNKLFQF